VLSASRPPFLLVLDDFLDGRADHPIGTFSRGMRQRLGIARALVNQPAVVFLDEPTLGLDPGGQRQILSLIRRMAENMGSTVLLSTHLLAEVEEVCTRVLILNHGRVAAEGTVSEVRRRAAAPRTATLRVAPEGTEAALAVFSRAAKVTKAEVTGGPPGSLRLTLSRDAGDEGGELPWAALADAGVHLLGFELEGARLSDAFVKMTEPGRDGGE